MEVPLQKQNNLFGQIGGCLQTALFSLIFILVGAGLSWWGWTILQNARSSASWPSVQGQITGALLDYSTDADGGDSYSPQVTYAYAVNGRSYEGQTIKFGENSYGSKRKAQEILERYPNGQRIAVFYNPAQPDRAVLEPGVSGGSYIVLGIGLLFVFLSLFGIVFVGVRSFLRLRQ